MKYARFQRTIKWGQNITKKTNYFYTLKPQRIIGCLPRIDQGAQHPNPVDRFHILITRT